MPGQIVNRHHQATIRLKEQPWTWSICSFIFILSVFLGFELIAKVPATLHTPLMSGSNAISGITIVGALVGAGGARLDADDRARHLRRGVRNDQRGRRLPGHRPDAGDVQEAGQGQVMSMNLLINLSYIVAAVLFIFGLKMLGSPATARRGNTALGAGHAAGGGGDPARPGDHRLSAGFCSGSSSAA